MQVRGNMEKPKLGSFEFLEARNCTIVQLLGLFAENHFNLPFFSFCLLSSNASSIATATIEAKFLEFACKFCCKVPIPTLQ